MTFKKIVKTFVLSIVILGLAAAASHWAVHGTLDPTAVSWQKPRDGGAS